MEVLILLGNVLLFVSGTGSTQLFGMLFGSLPKPRYLEFSNGVMSLK